ncbi:DUF4286 family protein [Cyclobacteriaceae bacterium]|nr:DUF4286 family protein [Cyclobacteriaceae bacterium]
MYVYNITFALGNEVDIPKWKQDIQQKLIAEVFEKKISQEHHFLELVKSAHGDAGLTFTCQFHVLDQEKVEQIENEVKPKLDHYLFLNYGEQCLSFVTVLQQA